MSAIRGSTRVSVDIDPKYHHMLRQYLLAGIDTSELFNEFLEELYKKGPNNVTIRQHERSKVEGRNSLQQDRNK